MRIILDTNVFISGIFWSGPPYKILNAWKEKKLKLIYSQDILDEYIRVGKILEKKYEGIEVWPFIDLLAIYGEIHVPTILNQPVSNDLDDDKFIACALGAQCKIIISGDNDLLQISGFSGIEILKPSKFVHDYL